MRCVAGNLKSALRENFGPLLGRQGSCHRMPPKDYSFDSGFDLCGIGNRVRGADSISAIASSNSEKSANGDNRGQGKGRLAVFNGSGFHLSLLKIWVDSREGFDISITLKNVCRLEWSTLQFF